MTNVNGRMHVLPCWQALALTEYHSEYQLSCQRQSSPVHHCPSTRLIFGIGKANDAVIVLTEVVADKPLSVSSKQMVTLNAWW